MANPRRRTRALRYFGAGGWPVGLPETIFRATAKASATASLALASVVLALAPVILTLGAGPSGFSKQFSGRRPKLPRQPWQTRTVARARSVILALGAGPSGFPTQFSGRRPKLLRQPPSRSLPSFWRWGLARRASRNKFSSDAKRGDLGRRQPWQTRAVARARSVISALGAGGWPVGLPETSFRATQSGGILEAAAAYAARSLCRNTGGGRNGRFINQKRTSGQIPSFGQRMADFILSRIRSLSAARPSNF